MVWKNRTFINMKIISLFFAAVILLTGCVADVSADMEIEAGRSVIAIDSRATSLSARDIYNYNVIVALDLSNRITDIYPRNLTDQEIVNMLMESFFGKLIYDQNRTMNQKDRFQIKFMNSVLIQQNDINADKLTIDLADFDTQLKRIDYLKNRSERKLSTDTADLINQVDKCIKGAKAKAAGCDVWKFMESDINELDVRNKDIVREMYGRKVVEKFKNVIVIITDGYIEAGLYGAENCANNLCYDLSQSRINRFRDKYNAHGENAPEKFFTENGYGIVPISNKNIEGADVLVLELNDRSLSKSGNIVKRPRDFQIMEMYWTDWLKKSGAARVKVCEISESAGKIKETFERFAISDKLD